MVHPPCCNFSIVPQHFRCIKFMIYIIEAPSRFSERYMRSPKLENSVLLDYLVSNYGMVLDFSKRFEWGIYRIFFYQGDSHSSGLYVTIMNITTIIIILLVATTASGRVSLVWEQSLNKTHIA